jgi:hypothetical protein
MIRIIAILLAFLLLSIGPVLADDCIGECQIGVPVVFEPVLWMPMVTAGGAP